MWKDECCNRKRRGLEGRRSIADFAIDVVEMVLRVLMLLWMIWNLSSLERSTFLSVIILTAPRVFWKSSYVYTAYISLPCSPICSVCSLHNNLRYFPFALSKYQTDLDIYICLMKYTSSLTVPKWLIYCYVMISIKISSPHEIEMLSLIAIWSKECFLHRNKWCMLTSQFC